MHADMLVTLILTHTATALYDDWCWCALQAWLRRPAHAPHELTMHLSGSLELDQEDKEEFDAVLRDGMDDDSEQVDISDFTNNTVPEAGSVSKQMAMFLDVSGEVAPKLRECITGLSLQVSWVHNLTVGCSQTSCM